MIFGGNRPVGGNFIFRPLFNEIPLNEWTIFVRVATSFLNIFVVLILLKFFKKICSRNESIVSCCCSWTWTLWICFLTVMDVSLDLATSADWLNAREAADHLSESGAVLDLTSFFFFFCSILSTIFSFFQQFPFDLIRLQFVMQILCKWGAGKCLKFSFEKFDFVSNSTLIRFF